MTMALYEYVCEWCEELVEINHPMHNEPKVYCPRCVKLMRKSFSVPQVTFKGVGFYSTDK
jgi:putative FmdB family regulatory protein